VQGTEVARQGLYRVAVGADRGAVQEDEADAERRRAALSPFVWRKCSEGRVALSEEGAQCRRKFKGGDLYRQREAADQARARTTGKWSSCQGMCAAGTYIDNRNIFLAVLQLGSFSTHPRVRTRTAFAAPDALIHGGVCVCVCGGGLSPMRLCI
jgi:hypothetical protein